MRVACPDCLYDLEEMQLVPQRKNPIIYKLILGLKIIQVKLWCYIFFYIIMFEVLN